MTSKCLPVASESTNKVSVILPFYNRVDLVIEAIDSVLSQTYQNFELILIDDGSTDDVSRITTKASTDSRLKYVRQANAGPGKARNVGVSISTGVYVAFLDSDDRFLPTKLEQQVLYLQENQFDITHTSYIRSDFQGGKSRIVHSGQIATVQAKDLIAECPIAMPTVLGRADVFRYTHFPEDISFGEDVCLWIKLAATYSFGGFDVPLSVVRVGPDSASANIQKQAEGSLNVVRFLINDPYLSKFRLEISQLQKFGEFMSFCSSRIGSLGNANHFLINRVSPALRVCGVLKAYGVTGVLRRVRRRVHL